MRYRRSVLSWLLALGLLMQWAGAMLPHARAMVVAGRLMPVELCSPSGMRMVLVDESGQPPKKVPGTENCCDLCQAPAALEAQARQDLPGPVSHAVPPVLAMRAGLPPFPPRAPPQLPRAPPAA